MTSRLKTVAVAVVVRKEVLQDMMLVVTRAPIDQLFSRESSASLNLVSDRSEHPVYDHLLIHSPRLPPTQSDAVISNE